MPDPRRCQGRKRSGPGAIAPRGAPERAVSHSAGRNRQPRRSLYEWPPERWIEAAGGDWRRAGGRWRGPCPACGAAMEVRSGGRGTLATCWGGGCTAAAIAEAIRPRDGARFRRTARGAGARRDERPRTRQKTRPEGESASEAILRPSGGGSPSKPPKPGGSAETEARKSPVTNERHPPRGRSTPGIRPGTNEHAPPVNAARRLWERSRPVPDDPEHPARRWSARRNLWPPGDPWPESVRWTEGPDGGGSLVAAFAPVADWTLAHPPPHPSGVQLVHVDPVGLPRNDRGGLAKRSHGAMTGAVCVAGPPLWRAGRVHVAEGIADALAIAARVAAPALATGGTSGLARLAEPLAALCVPVTVWPDGDRAGCAAGRKLCHGLEARGIAASVADVPDGEDPASLAGPSNDWRQRA